MMYVFVGPTIQTSEASKHLDAVFLPPAEQGDVYRVSLEHPIAIGIIDGFFDRVPAVWHKEVLWALSQGIHVFGASSMGALRAAELADFGMIGVGRIFRWFRDGVLDSDDEVAVAHAPLEFGYRQNSEALVNIRATIEKACGDGILTQAVSSTLIEAARVLFYPDRIYPRIIDEALSMGLLEGDITCFRSWWKTGRIDQKREDAIEMLCTMREYFTSEVESHRPCFVFQETALWNELKESVHRIETSPVNGDTRWEEILQEQGGCNKLITALNEAANRVLAVHDSARRGFSPSEQQLIESVIRFRAARGLEEPEQLTNWLNQHNLDKAGFMRLVDEEARIHWMMQLLHNDAVRALPNTLRIRDEYTRFFGHTPPL